MKPILLIDFGSTYTKVTCADGDTGCLYATAQSHTTVQEDISIGLSRAVTDLSALSGIREFAETYACSSAAGGLRMIACGLVPSLTAEAAKRAALGAGAKVIRTFAYDMTDEDALEIENLRPDIALVCGGTDGGNRACAINNCGVLARVKADFPVVLACNRQAAGECARILQAASREVITCENVMPAFGQLNIVPAQNAIRALFLRRIISAKGLSKAQSLIDDIVMPTPAAVLDALNALSEITGELMAVDLGGATTDVYSIADGSPTRSGAVMRGLPEPYAKRTVEGDIGMRISAHGVLEAAGIERLVELSRVSEPEVVNWLSRVRETPEFIAYTEVEKAIDNALAILAIETGLARHAGEIEQVFTPIGAAYQQTGKDLTNIRLLVLTGGALVHSPAFADIARAAMCTRAYPKSLMPRDAAIALDRHYILSAAGLLHRNHPQAAKALLGKEFT